MEAALVAGLGGDLGGMLGTEEPYVARAAAKRGGFTGHACGYE